MIGELIATVYEKQRAARWPWWRALHRLGGGAPEFRPDSGILPPPFAGLARGSGAIPDYTTAAPEKAERAARCLREALSGSREAHGPEVAIAIWQLEAMADEVRRLRAQRRKLRAQLTYRHGLLRQLRGRAWEYISREAAE